MDNKELDKAAEQYGKGSEYPQQLENAFVAGAEWYVDKMSHIHGAVEAIQKSLNGSDNIAYSSFILSIFTYPYEGG